MVSEFEKNREMIYKLLRVLGGVMEVNKNGQVTQWVFDIKTEKLKRIK
jgi:hypothetical protein